MASIKTIPATSSLQNDLPAPTHPNHISINYSAEAFGASATSLADLPAGALFAKMTTTTPGSETYTSVQTGSNTEIELNSDLVFCNHSCAPSLVFDMARLEARVVDDGPLKKGDELTFFYPSTEWDMTQPFHCTCGAEDCIGWVSGAKGMDEKVLGKYWLNYHNVGLRFKEQ
jgi:hypothetical protein